VHLRGRLTVLALLIVLLACACGESSPQGEAVRQSVAIVPPAMVSPFHVAIVDGAVAAGEALGWEVMSRAPVRETDFEGHITIIEQFVQQGVDAISINPINSDAIISAVLVANNRDTPVFMHNTITPIAQGDVVEYIGYDQWGGAARLAEYVCGLLANKDGVDREAARGKVFIVTGIPGFHTNRRTGGFVDGLRTMCPGVEIVGSQTAEWEREKGLQVATTILQQVPDIDVFYGNSDEMAIGACLAASLLGYTVNEDIFCVGIDGNAVTLDLIREGAMTATLGVYPQRMGEVVIQQMNRYLLGEEIPPILLTPSVVVDIDNLEAYIEGTTWVEPVSGPAETDNGLPTIPDG
jgi:ribose transport system substrate-binding protein